jgi:cyclophilin family peptidyl-prolyl cis-trans isomerase
MKKENIIIGTVVMLLVAFSIIKFMTQESARTTDLDNTKIDDYSIDGSNSDPNLQTDQTTPSAIIPSANMQMKKYQATLNTSEGKIVIKFNDNQTPKTVENFVTLAKKGFYNNTIFHRVIKGFMIQGGDPEGTGRGGPGYRFDDEPFTGEYTRGTIAMANSGPNTNGSQFFIMHADYPLPKNYVIFGKVTEGIEVVDKIAIVPVTQSESGETSKPVNPVKILEVTITEL